jgi:hypothetical protein
VKKVDLFREHQDEYVMSRDPRLVNVGSGTYLTVTGSGSPRSAEFRRHVGALYGCAYTIKFDNKLDRERDFKVGALEGLWWTKGKRDLVSSPKATWRWKLLIRVPSFVTKSAVASALLALRAKGRPIADVRREVLREGRSVQALHVGSYAEEPETIAKMNSFARERKLRLRGKHHEIYLSDPRRVPEARLRTILRHPVSALRTRPTA